MATEEPTNPAPEAAAMPPYGGVQPNYPEMIMAAIEALNDKNGSNKSAILRHIEANHGDVPPANSTLVAHYLNQMKLSGEIVMVKNNYMKPDPNAPPKRGRGRPPKPKDPPAPSVAAAMASSPRPRGRPPKARDPRAPPPPPKAAAPSVSGRKRGRPPKNAAAAPPPPAAAPTPPPAAADGSVAKRGRGRPPKVKPAVAPVGA